MHGLLVSGASPQASAMLNIRDSTSTTWFAMAGGSHIRHHMHSEISITRSDVATAPFSWRSVRPTKWSYLRSHMCFSVVYHIEFTALRTIS